MFILCRVHPIILRSYNCQLIVMISSAGHNVDCFDFEANFRIHIPSINTYQIKSFALLHFNQLCGYVLISCSQQIVYSLIYFDKFRTIFLFFKPHLKYSCFLLYHQCLYDLIRSQHIKYLLFFSNCSLCFASRKIVRKYFSQLFATNYLD